jgi:hypothetical protein
MYSCHQTRKTYDYRKKSLQIYAQDLEFLKNYIGRKLKEAFPEVKNKWNKLKLYPDFYYLCDQLVREADEGYPSRANFSSSDWALIKSVQVVFLTKSLDREAVKLLVSRNF